MLRRQRRAGCRTPSDLAMLALWGILFAACSANHTGTHSNSGETHFLRACADGCGEGLTCLCGLCTLECASSSACEALAERATCSVEGGGVCNGHPGARACEVACTSDASCGHLGRGLRCMENTCRAEARLEDAGDRRRDASVGDASALDASPPEASAEASVEAGIRDGGSSSDGRVGVTCGAAICTSNQRCCDHCQNYCEEATADLVCPDDSSPNRACTDASQAVRCGAVTCGVNQVCCDHCASRCVPAQSGALCPDDTQPNRSCNDAATAQCAPLLGSCLTTPCCSGLSCCSGVPIPEGTAVCYAQGCPISDRAQKTGFADIDHQRVLDRVVALPIQSWRYKHEPDSVSHIGPMAQDFQASFGVGADDKHIFPLDEGGVSLAAIQALHQRLSRLVDAQNKLREENARLRIELNDLRRELHER